MKSRNLIPIITIILLLCSCGRDNPRYKIGVSQCSDDEWRSQVNQEIMREAMFYDGVEVEIRTVKDDTEKQKQDIRYFIDQGVDLIVLAPNEAAPMTAIVEEAFDKGIAIIVFDRMILSDKYTAWVGADNYEIGKSVGNYIASMLKGKGTVAELAGLTGSTPALDRHQGFMSAISRYPDIELLCKEDAGWLREEAEIKMDTILSRFNQIDVLYAQNDRMAAGAYQTALKRNRRNQIRFIGIDATSGEGYGVDMVEKGILDATFIYPTGGDKIVQIAMDILEGRQYPRETLLTTAVVDATNAHVMTLQTNQISELDNKIKTLNGKIDAYLSQFATQQVVLYGSLIILLLVVGLLLVVYSSLRSKNRLNKELSRQKEQLEQQRDQLIELSRQLEEATHAKLVFFTNISHDFRTPLTLVADPVEHLLTDKSLSKEQSQLLQMVKRNVDILLRLVNQILDFRKYENGKLEFNPVKMELSGSLQEWNSSFLAAARKKHIHFSFNFTPDTQFYMEADMEKMERIYYNLLSNAFKFTPENGKISVWLNNITQADGRRVYQLQVANTGSLISSEHIKSIFDRFYKIDMHHSGSGIGLALVKAFVELHGGTISVQSDERIGTVFTVEFPVHTEPFAETETRSFSSLPELSIEDNSEEETYDPSKPTILIIDDNADIRIYIRGLLQTEYSVIEAANGAEGIRKAMKYVPDVIISDVMMPGMDGIECCRRLKSELQTCHIPVILLTACSLDEQRIKGYDGGADSYISKPFNSQVLQSRIRNLIDSAHRIKRAFSDNEVITRENVCDMDKEFVDKFKSLIEEQMSDTALNVEDIGKQMGLSRVQLYRKIKSLTNYAPNELLRITRLKKAASLLASTELTIAEICYEVGFTSPSYFSKCYKEQYGESPSEFLKKKKGG
ncbi:substrate-binding domain-containing protein [Bacteroides sp. 519]|uniref:hybrid sensor histidine kinase/response regulator transcription factor n=1 Tax=Bacteroides sp. 519 TaxID=2302937 RepID=UPI0013D09314|nr:substrate-binding domain-containing protein [Bacteroides sp. 519]NDV56615.1 response regulator [Bacteroides sp. 519]